jgi:hypothetical protein
VPQETAESPLLAERWVDTIEARPSQEQVAEAPPRSGQAGERAASDEWGETQDSGTWTNLTNLVVAVSAWVVGAYWLRYRMKARQASGD